MVYTHLSQAENSQISQCRFSCCQNQDVGTRIPPIPTVMLTGDLKDTSLDPKDGENGS